MDKARYLDSMDLLFYYYRYWTYALCYPTTILIWKRSPLMDVIETFWIDLPGSSGFTMELYLDWGYLILEV